MPLALVHDEYGHLDGIVTPGSILAALAGAFANDIDEGDGLPLVERDDGSWLVSGAASADLLSDRIGVAMPHERDYSTVAGFALSVLKRLPAEGEQFTHDGWSFEVVDMDGRKIDKLLVSRTRRTPRGDSRRHPGRAALELAEPLLEAIDVAAREVIGLLDDPVAGEAAAECAKRRIEAFDLALAQLGDLVEAGDPTPLRRVASLGPTPFSMTRSSGGPLAPGRLSCTRALMMSPARSLVAAAASSTSPRPSLAELAMCGRTGALSVNVTRWRGFNTNSSRASTISAPTISRIG